MSESSVNMVQENRNTNHAQNADKLFEEAVITPKKYKENKL